jgi:hypothetical protein
MPARLLLGAMLILCGSTVWSQVFYRGPYGGYHGPYGGYPGVYGGYPGWWGGFNYSGNIGITPAESQARGYAEAVRAQGEAYENISRGMVDYEKARSTYIENQKQWHETAIQRREMGLAQRNEYYAQERAKRERREAMNAQQTPPPMLGSSQYDRATGQIEWPELLQTDRFADDRKAIERMLEIRSQTGGAGGINDQIYAAARAMQTKLKTRIRDVTPQRYLESRKFLDMLATEARRSA